MAEANIARKAVYARIPADLRRQCRVLAAKKQCTLNDLMVMGLHNLVAEEVKRDPALAKAMETILAVPDADEDEEDGERG